MKPKKIAKATTTIVTAGLLCCFSLQASADISISQIYIPNTNIHSDDAPVGQSASIGMEILDFNIKVPLYKKMDAELGRPTLFINSLNFRQHKFNWDLPLDTTDEVPEKVYGISYGFEFIKPIYKKVTLVSFGEFGAYSDFEEKTDEKDFLMEGGLLAVYNFENGLDLGLGPIYTRAFGNPEFLIAPFVRYKYNNKILIDVRVPKHITVSYLHKDSFMIGIAARSVYSTYHINPDNQPEEGNIVFSDVTLGVEGTVAIFDGIVLDLSAAQAVKRILEIQDDNNNRIAERDLDNGIVYKAGLRLML